MRMQDLQALAQHALAAGDASAVARAATLFSGLPELPEEGADPAPNQDVGSAVWAGLLRRREWHQSLLDLRAELTPGGPVTPPPTPAEEGEGDGAGGDGAGGGEGARAPVGRQGDG